MADEISLTVQLNYANGDAKLLVNPGAIKITQSTLGLHAPIVTVNSSVEEDLAIGDIGTLGLLTLRNTDPTNYVTYGTKTSTGGMLAFGRIEASEVATLRLEPGTTVRWQANTAAVKVQVWLLED